MQVQDITEQNEARISYEGLFKNKVMGLAHCKVIFNDNNEPVDFKFIDVNDTYEKYTGLKREEVIGKTITKAIPGIDQSLIDMQNNVALNGEDLRYEFYEPNLKRWYEINVYSPQYGEFISIFTDISQKKETEERYNEFFTNPIVGLGLCKVVVDEKGEPVDYIYLEVNDAFEKFTGLKREEIINKGVREVLPEDANSLIDVFGPVGLTGGRIKVEVPIPTLSRIYEVDAYSPSKNHFIALFTDITERKKAEESLKNSEARYRSLYENNMDAILLTKPDGSILSANPTAQKIYGMTEEEITKAGRAGIVVKNEQLERSIEEREQTGKITSELTSKRKDGSTFPIEVTSSIFTDSDGTVKTSMIIRDLTERKKAEEELKKRSALLDISNEAIFSWNFEEGILSWNHGAEILYGYNSEETVDKISHDLLKTKFPLEFDEFKEKLTNDGIWTGELIHTTKDGKKIFVECNMQLITDASGKSIVIETNRDITEKKKIEKDKQTLLDEVQNERDMLSTLVNNIPDEVWFADKNKKFTLANPSALREFSLYSKDIDIEKLASNLDVYRSDGSPRPVEEAPPLRALKGEIIKNLEEIILIPSSNELRYRQVNASPVKDSDDNIIGSVSVVRDITENKKIQEKLVLQSNALKKSERSLDTAQHIAHIGSWEWNIKTGDITWSDELYSIYGVDPNTFTPTLSSFGDYMHPDDEEYVNQNVDQLLSENKPHNFDFRIILDDGSIRVLNTVAEVTKFDKNGEPEIIIGINQDITERKKIELKLNENIKKLAQSNKELEQFAYITSHDLREPLRMITSFLQLLEKRYKDQLDQDANEFIGFAVNGAKRLDTMTKDLLKYSKINYNKGEIKPVNFEHVLEHALTNIKVQIEENNAIITHDPLPIINANEELKIQLFQNIIGNAIKYRSQKTPKIHISAIKEKTQYIFSIKDNGIGMSSKHMEKIFTIFQRLHTHDEYEGTGIGLAIAQKIVHQQDGRIWAESEPGKGSIFYFTIPIK